MEAWDFSTAWTFFPALGYEVYPPGNWSFFPLAIFAVGLFRHDLLDLGIVLRKSLIYSLLTILLTGLYALIVVIFNRAFQNSEPLGSIYFSLTLFVVVALVFGPLKATVQRGVDHLFLRGRYDYQNTIRRISQMIVSVRRPEEIARKVTEAIFQTMKIDNCGFYVAEPLDGGIRAAALLQRPTETVWPERTAPGFSRGEDTFPTSRKPWCEPEPRKGVPSFRQGHLSIFWSI